MATEPARWHSGLLILYLVGAVLITDQVSELAIALSPFRLGEIPWRFGAVGLALGKATPILIADALIGGAAFGRGNWPFLRVWGWLHLGLGAALLVVLLGFGLDVMTLRRVATGKARVDMGRTAIRVLLVGTALSVFGVRAGLLTLRTARARSQASRQSAPIVGGGPSV